MCEVDNFKTERLACVETDRQTDLRSNGYACSESESDPDQEYIPNGVADFNQNPKLI